jgi:dihydrofolate reductase
MVLQMYFLETGKAMFKGIYYVAMSIDGFIAAPDGSVEWLRPFEGGNEDYGYGEFLRTVEALLMGSRTFEQFDPSSGWPYPEKLAWVFSNRNLSSPWPEAAITGQTPDQVVSQLERSGIRRAWLVGGGKLAASFRRERLIGEYDISVIPVILGEGIPLFGSAGPIEALRLIVSKVYPNGVVQNRYTVL